MKAGRWRAEQPGVKAPVSVGGKVRYEKEERARVWGADQELRSGVEVPRTLSSHPAACFGRRDRQYHVPGTANSTTFLSAHSLLAS